MTDNTDNIDHTPPKRRLRVRHVLLGILILLLLIWPVYYMRARANFEAACEKIRAAGYPITLAELNDWYKLPDGEENAADTILEAFTHFNKWDDEKRKPLPRIGNKIFDHNKPFDEETIQLAEEYLADNKEALTLLHNAAKIKHARYPVDLEDISTSTITMYLSEIKQAAQLLSIEASISADKGQADRAIDSIDAIASLTRSLSTKPDRISQLVSIAVNAMSLSDAERILNRCTLSKAQLQRLTNIIAEMDGQSLMSTALIGERCSLIATMKNGYTGYYGTMTSHVITALRITGFAYKDALVCLDLLAELQAACQLPLEKRVKAVELIEKKVDSLSPVYYMTHMSMGTLVEKIDIRYNTYRKVAQTAIAIEQWKLDHGQTPENLNQLVPQYLEKVPIDPFDGNPLRYIISDEGFMIYSIGENKIDEGGLKKGMKDIVFEIRRAYTKTTPTDSKQIE